MEDKKRKAERWIFVSSKPADKTWHGMKLKSDLKNIASFFYYDI